MRVERIWVKTNNWCLRRRQTSDEENDTGSSILTAIVLPLAQAMTSILQVWPNKLNWFLKVIFHYLQSQIFSKYLKLENLKSKN